MCIIWNDVANDLYVTKTFRYCRRIINEIYLFSFFSITIKKKNDRLMCSRIGESTNVYGASFTGCVSHRLQSFKCWKCLFKNVHITILFTESLVQIIFHVRDSARQLYCRYLLYVSDVSNIYIFNWTLYWTFPVNI